MRRFAGITVGLATQVLFLFMVWHLFWFLKGGHAEHDRGSLWIDLALALQFTVPHSLLLLPAVRRRLGRWIPAAFYGCFFCAATCLGLLVTLAFWRSSPVEVWHINGWARTGLEAAFIGSWIALFYSLSLTGLAYQTGLKQWWYWVRRRPQTRREFKPRGAYQWLRHPAYLSFLGLLWFAPVMTLDRAILTGIWTVYIFVGSHLKDERLAFYLGESYRTYQSQVPGYPFFPFGPLGKRPFLPESSPHDGNDVATQQWPERTAA